MTIWQIFDRIERARDTLDDVPEEVASAIEDELDALEESARGLSTTVALLGDTNTGKSTLVNALVNGNVLPKSGVGIGTASLTQLFFRPGSEFTAEIQFATRGELTQQCLFLYEHSNYNPFDGTIDIEFLEMVDAIKRRLARIYGPTLDAYLESGRLGVLSESDEARAALSEGRRAISADTEQELRDQLIDFIDSSGSSPQLVRHVSVSGPFETLRTGITLVDLPGLNDPDAHRSSITQRSIAEADMVWIVFAVDAGMAKSLVRAMQSMLPLHELLLEGRADRLAFVVTKCDQVDVDDAKRIGVDPDVDLSGFIEGRREFVERDIRDKIDLLTLPFRHKLGSAANQALDALRSTPIYFVSSLDHLRFVGAETGFPTFGRDEQTQLPALADYLVQLGARRGDGDAIAELDRELDQLEQRIARVADDPTAPTMPALDLRQHPLLKRFETEVTVARDNFQRDVAVAIAQLISTLTDATRRMVTALDEATEKWSQMSPATLRTTAQRRGLFIAQGGVRHDLNADVAQPFLYAAYPAWTAFFEQTLPLLIRQYQSFLTSVTERVLVDLQLSAAGTDGIQTRSFEREALELTKLERGDIVGALVEVIREQLADVYEDVTADDTSFAKNAAIKRIRDAVVNRQATLSQVIADELHAWLGGLADSLNTLAQHETGTRAQRIARLA